VEPAGEEVELGDLHPREGDPHLVADLLAGGEPFST